MIPIREAGEAIRLFDTLKSLSIPRQLILVGAILGVVFAMTFLVRGVTQSPMALLYSGLDASHAGEIVEELDQRGVEYEIRGAAIFIPERDRDAVRIALAKDGLPRQAVQGYELLDDVNGFSVTSEMYNATYWRAKEGELTRTILAIPGVSSARVHIGASLRSGFSRSQASPTASVTVATSTTMNKSQAEAIQYLVALAVPGLRPEEVAVIDAAAGVVAGPGVGEAEAPAMVAETQSGALEQKILRLLDARVGPGNARVSVSVDVSRERQRVSAVTYDPDSRVIRNRTTTDTSETSQGGVSAGLTVASNLPQEGGGEGGDTSSTENSTESVSYEVNETRTETETLPGQIERISVAVLLNDQALGIDLAANAGAAEQIAEEFQQLVASAAGLDLARGDSLTVELMPFLTPALEELTAAPGLFEQLMQRYFWSALQAGLLGVVVIILGVGVVRPLLRPGQGGEAGAIGESAALLGQDGAAQKQDPFNYLQDYARERQDETVALLQEWLDEDGKVVTNE